MRECKVIKMPDAPPFRTRMDGDPRPYLRWWWFSRPMDPRDIDRQVAWSAANGFGGLEIAWVYPMPGKGLGPAFLSPQWTALVAHARQACLRAGMGCDFTFGSMWPFGGSFVSEEDASLTWRGPSAQRLDRSWEMSHVQEPGRILNHLSAESLRRYAGVLGSALAPAFSSPDGLPDREGPSLFCDSWEVESEGLWTRGFGEKFKERFGYDVLPYMEHLDQDPDVRYEYRTLLAEYVLHEFYIPYTRICHELGAASRVQCHGAPTDVLAAYAAVDVPESETVLFPPEFSSIPASAALLARQKTVSAEAFTCLYGWVPWPAEGPHMGEERLDDLKLTADAIFASGINHIVWHGMPFQAAGERARFYATVYVGPDAAMADSYPGFNEYLGAVCARMKQGAAYARVACYLPLEDARMAGELPAELRGPSAAHYWELQHLQRPPETRPYAPAWISAAFFSQAAVEDGMLRVRDASFEALFVDSQWMDRDALHAMVGFAEAGIPIVLKKRPREPGGRASSDYDRLLRRLASLPCVYSRLSDIPKLRPVLSPTGSSGLLPPYWVRRDGERYTVFLAHPRAAAVRYPLPYGFAEQAGPMDFSLDLCLGKARREVRLAYEAQGALLLSTEGDAIRQTPLRCARA